MKRTFRKILILILVFVAAVAAAVFFVSKRGDEEAENAPEAPRSETAPLVTPPEIAFEYNGMTVNRMACYAGDEYTADEASMTLPVEADGLVSVLVFQGSEPVSDIVYKLFSADEGSLLEEGKATVSGGRADIKLSRFGGAGTPLLVLSAFSGENTYSGAIRISGNHTERAAGLLDYAVNFHTVSMDGGRREELRPVLETADYATTRDLSQVDIASSLEMVTWGSLEPKPAGTVEAELHSFDEECLAVTLKYCLSALGSDTRTRNYEVEEYFYLRHVDSLDTTYLLTYDRRMNEVFVPGEKNVLPGSIQLGIQSGDVVYMADPDGVYTAFQVNGNLWLYCAMNHEISRLFSLYESDGKQISAGKGRNGMKLLDVDADGNVSFLVYGYGASIFAAGGIGTACYRYERESNRVVQYYYEPSSLSLTELSSQAQQLGCLGNGGMLYFLNGDTVSSLDFAGQLRIPVLTEASAHHLVTSDDTDVFAWENHSENENSITIMVPETGISSRIESGEGPIVPLAFTQSDLVFGHQAKEEALQGFDSMPLYSRIEIAGPDGTILKEYTPEDCLVSGVDVENNRILVSLVKENAEGVYFECGEEILIQNEEGESREEKVSLKTRVYEQFLKSAYLSVPLLSGSDKLLSVSEPVEEGIQGEFSQSTASPGEERANAYRVYLHGDCRGMYDSAGKAILAASTEKGGYVADLSGRMVFRREALDKSGGYPFTFVTGSSDLASFLRTISLLDGCGGDAEALLAKGLSAKEALSEMVGGRLVDASGCGVKDMFYYLERKCWVLTCLDTGDYSGYALLTGYESLYDTVYYVGADGVEKALDLAEAEKAADNMGNIFLTVPALSQ